MGSIELRQAIEREVPGLRQAGITALFLFGSLARGDANEASDVDLLFEVGDDLRFSLLDQVHLQLSLEAKLGRKVDFVERRALRPRMRERVEREMVRLL